MICDVQAGIPRASQRDPVAVAALHSTRQRFIWRTNNGAINSIIDGAICPHVMCNVYVVCSMYLIHHTSYIIDPARCMDARSNSDNISLDALIWLAYLSIADSVTWRGIWLLDLLIILVFSLLQTFKFNRFCHLNHWDEGHWSNPAGSIYLKLGFLHQKVPDTFQTSQRVSVSRDSISSFFFFFIFFIDFCFIICSTAFETARHYLSTCFLSHNTVLFFQVAAVLVCASVCVCVCVVRGARIESATTIYH